MLDSSGRKAHKSPVRGVNSHRAAHEELGGFLTNTNCTLTGTERLPPVVPVSVRLQDLIWGTVRRKDAVPWVP
jgi:hypothetical protein